MYSKRERTSWIVLVADRHQQGKQFDTKSSRFRFRRKKRLSFVRCGYRSVMFITSHTRIKTYFQQPILSKRTDILLGNWLRTKIYLLVKKNCTVAKVNYKMLYFHIFLILRESRFNNVYEFIYFQQAKKIPMLALSADGHLLREPKVYCM